MAFFGITIEEIESIKPIEGADRIVQASLKNMSFQFVIQKDAFKVDDKVCYFPVDSIFPINIQEKLGLVGKLSGSNKDRVKTIKLNGVYSLHIL